jgi:8-oxo-dGTP pyrophosphatase MutT (NUDIX family)
MLTEYEFTTTDQVSGWNAVISCTQKKQFRPTVIAAIHCAETERFLLAKAHDSDFVFIQGGVEVSDGSFSEATLREIAEEVGYETIKHLVGIEFLEAFMRVSNGPNDGYRSGKIYFPMLVTVANEVDLLNPTAEIDEIQWLSSDEIRKGILLSNIKDYKRKNIIDTLSLATAKLMQMPK